MKFLKDNKRAAVSLILSSLFVLQGCEKDQDKSSIEQNVGSSELVETTAEVESMTYDKSTHAINLKLIYGGCEKTKHVLKLNSVCLESYPMQCSATLKRPKTFNDSCKMIIREDVSLILEKNFDTSTVSLQSAGKTNQVLVDRTGKIESPRP